MSDTKIETGFQNQRNKKALQDTKVPFLIHRVNGRLLPNVERLRTHKDMIPYMGNKHASLEERMRYLRTGGQRRGVVATQAIEAPPPFDVSTATKEDMIAFAADEFGLELNPKAPIHIMRNQIIAAAKEADEAPAGDDTNLG